MKIKLSLEEEKKIQLQVENNEFDLTTSDNNDVPIEFDTEFKGEPGPPGPPGPPGGVNSWNTRQGEVLPRSGDYTPGMVGMEELSNSDIDNILRSLGDL